MKTIINGIIHENPTFVLILGLCPTLAVTNNFESSYIMGLSLLFVLFFSSLIFSILKHVITSNVKIPVYVIITGTFVTILGLLLERYVPELNKTLGIYLPLIAINCIILGRALAVASKEKVGKTLLDSIGIGIGFTLALMIMGLIREVIGSNTITIMDGISPLTGYQMIYQIFPTNDFLPITFFKEPVGAFITLGLLIGIFNAIKSKKEVVNNESN